MFFRTSAILVLSLVIGLGALTHTTSTALASDDFSKQYKLTSPPRPVPPFLFVDQRGVTHDIKEYRGRNVLLNIWATWCAPCKNEMPALNALQQKFDFRILNVVAINEDSNGITAARSFYQNYNLKHLPVFADASGQAPSILNVQGLPTTLLVNTQGMEIGRVVGEADWSSPETIAFIRKQIK